MKIAKFFIVPALFMLAACGNSNKESNQDDWGDEIEESYDEEYDMEDDYSYDDSSTDSLSFTVSPLTTEVEGPLKGIVEVVDKEYTSSLESAMGDSMEIIHLEFKILKPQKITKEIRLYGYIYDEEGKLVTIRLYNSILSKDKNDTVTREYALQSWSASYLQMAIANGDEVCKKTSLLIRVNRCPFYNEEMKRFKTFKVVSELSDYDFDYESHQ